MFLVERLSKGRLLQKYTPVLLVNGWLNGCQDVDNLLRYGLTRGNFPSMLVNFPGNFKHCKLLPAYLLECTHADYTGTIRTVPLVPTYSPPANPVVHLTLYQRQVLFVDARDYLSLTATNNFYKYIDETSLTVQDLIEKITEAALADVKDMKDA